ncbi:dermonecrotic toxin domain-containing protein [Pseudomonas gingeri]
MNTVLQEPANGVEAPALSAPESALEHFGKQLAERLALSKRPSLLLNRLQAALVRGLDSQYRLKRLFERAPRIGDVLQRLLSEAFGHDPHRLLFIPPLRCGDGQLARTLAQVAMSLLRNPFLSLGSGLGVRLGLVGEPDNALQLDPGQVLAHLKSLGLSSRIDTALRSYWEQPAYDSNLSRRERLIELHKLLFHDKVLLAYGLGGLSAGAVNMLMGLLDAPTPEARTLAGDRWARLMVSELVWPAEGQATLALSGSLHLHGTGSVRRGRQVVFVPGAPVEFFEFADPAEMHRRLPEVLNAPGNYRPWQLLALQERHRLFPQGARPALPYHFQDSPALAGDAFAHSALSRLETQLANEWAAALLLNSAYLLPEGLADAARLTPLQAVEAMQESRTALTGLPAVRTALAQRLLRDEHRRMLEITFGSLAMDLPVRLRQSKLRQQERGLLKLLDEPGPGRDSPAYNELLGDHERWRQQAADLQALLRDRQDWSRAGFWQADGKGNDLGEKWLKGRCQALLYEARIQHRLGLLDQKELERILDVLPQAPPGRVASDTRIVGIAVGPDDSPWLLTGACVISTRQALADRRVSTSALLFVPGRQGGLQRFISLDSLAQRLGITLLSPECDSLWPLIARDQRGDARRWVRSLPAGERLAVHYPPIAADALQHGLQQQIQAYLRVCRAVEGGLRPFSQVADAPGSLQWLADELAQNLAVPGHDARERALDNLAALQLGAVQAQGLPAWLSGASRSTRQQYARRLARYQNSVQALELKLERQLPDLDDFARGKLIERLRQDGWYPGLDIDKPLFDLPDSVERVWAGHPERVVGESGPKTVVSDTRHTYSLLRLALENLDPQSMGSRRRLQHGRLLDPAWQQRLTPDYLIATISALDLGGQYDSLIQRAFYGVEDPRREQPREFDRALLYRLVRQRAAMELFSARQQGLGDWAAEAFEVALNAEFAVDLRTARLDLELHRVTFAGRAFARARHVGNAVAIHDRISGKTLVYLPGAPHEQVLTEHADLAAAQRALVKTEQASQRVADIVQRLAAGWDREVVEGYPAEQEAYSPRLASLRGDGTALVLQSAAATPVVVARSTTLLKVIRSWWTSEPESPVPDSAALEKEVRREIAENPGHWLRLVKTERCDLSLLLAHAFVLRAQQRARSVSNSNRQLAQLRELREREERSAYWRRVLSVVPVVSVAVNAYETAVALRRFHRSGDPRDALELFKAAHMTLVDAALTFFPAGLATRPARVGQGLWPRAALKSLSQRQALSHKGAMALKKLDRSARPRPILPGYEANIAGDDAVALHGPTNAGSYVKNGVQFITDGSKRYEVYQAKGESSLRLKKTATQDNELILHIHEPGEYLLRADAPEPQPGPSRAMWQPWTPPAPSQPAAAPVLQLEWMTRRPALLPADWATRGLLLENEQLVELSASRGIYTRRGADMGRLLKLDGRYFELLPDGSQVHPDIVFLKRPGPSAALARIDFSHWWSHLDEQPIPATFDPPSQTWTVRAALFGEPMEQSLAQPLRGMTPISLQRTINRLIERSDVAYRSVTASRMVALKRTQEAWSLRGVHMDVLLRELDAQALGRTHFSIGRATDSVGFSRLDFEPPQAVDPRLFDARGPARIAELASNSETAVIGILRRHGFVVNEIPKSQSFNTVNLYCTHPGSNHLYYVMLKWTDKRSVPLTRYQAGPRQLSDDWFNRHFEFRPLGQRAVLKPVKEAMNEGRLVKIIAGLQRSTDTGLITVFFTRAV